MRTVGWDGGIRPHEQFKFRIANMTLAGGKRPQSAGLCRSYPSREPRKNHLLRWSYRGWGYGTYFATLSHLRKS